MIWVLVVLTTYGSECAAWAFQLAVYLAASSVSRITSRFSALLSSAALVKLKLPVMTVCAVDDHDLVVGDGVLGVDQRRDARVQQEVGREYFSVRWLLSRMTCDLHAPLVGIDQGLGDRGRGEAVGLDEDVSWRRRFP